MLRFSLLVTVLLTIQNVQSIDFDECPSFVYHNCSKSLVGEFIPSPFDCRRYYVCLSNHRAYLRTCSRGLHFNPKSNTCDWVRDTQCPPFAFRTQYKPDYHIPVYPPFECVFPGIKPVEVSDNNATFVNNTSNITFDVDDEDIYRRISRNTPPVDLYQLYSYGKAIKDFFFALSKLL